MRNAAPALAIGFRPEVLTEEGFLKRWAVFRESEHYKFLVLFMQKRVGELQLLLESAKPDDLLKLQGQIQEAKKLLGFLEQPSIVNEIKTVAAFLGLKV